jgi:hypothetical protein
MMLPIPAFDEKLFSLKRDKDRIILTFRNEEESRLFFYWFKYKGGEIFHEHLHNCGDRDQS